MGEKPELKCVVVGAGPVGALAALYAAARGWQVEVYELRGDLRHEATTPLNFTKSINLALSERGINAMRRLGNEALLQSVLSDTIPMHGRMVHGSNSNGEIIQDSQPYDIHGRSILAVDRSSLNRVLLDALDQHPNVKLLFHHKLTGADLVKKKAWFEQNLSQHSQGSDDIGKSVNSESVGQRHTEIEVGFDIILGCDGAHSSVRYHMMKFVRMSYQQTYIDVLWCEFTMRPLESRRGSESDGSKEFAISPDHLHIWPGPDKMFIAIPSTDRTFTCTLFASAGDFAELEANPSSIRKFFDSNFPGAAQLIGPKNLQEQFARNPHLPLISIKCAPHHFASTAIILGDAAHAMVPFYGQGMNAGLEDVRVLFSHLDAHEPTTGGRAVAFSEYSAQRVPDAHTINDLALANYWEMRAGVRSPIYLFRKKVEEFLAHKVPGSGFLTQYSRVSFSNQRYSEIARAVSRQATILASVMFMATTIPLVVWLIWRPIRYGRLARFLGSFWSGRI